MAFKIVSWAAQANIYEVNVRQYTPQGTFGAFATHLERLRSMGVDILWFMPITPISHEKRQGILGSYYACSSYVEINPEFGDLKSFKALVNHAHKLGFKVIIDWVANHTGYDHHWTTEHPDWYEKDVNGNFVEKHGWKDVIDLNYASSDMRNAMISAMQFWIKECNIDGFRCDMAHLVPLDFWIDARNKCDAIKPLFWLAECDDKTYHEAFDYSYTWKWMHITEDLVKKHTGLGPFRNVLKEYQSYGYGHNKLFFTSNHDENSWNGTEYEKYNGLAKALAVFTVTYPGMPLVYSGQELPNLKRLKFFEKDTIEWKPEKKLEPFYHSLLTLRNQHHAFDPKGKFIDIQTGKDDLIYAFLRVSGNDKLLVLLNLSGADRVRFTIMDSQLSGEYKNLFSGIPYTLKESVDCELQSGEYAVYYTVTGIGKEEKNKAVSTADAQIKK